MRSRIALKQPTAVTRGTKVMHNGAGELIAPLQESKTALRRRGIKVGDLVELSRPKVPWTQSITVKGEVIEVTEHFFVVQHTTGIRECFLFADLITGVVTVNHKNQKNIADAEEGGLLLWTER